MYIRCCLWWAQWHVWYYVFQKQLILDNLSKGSFTGSSHMPEYKSETSADRSLCAPASPMGRKVRETKREHPLAQCAMTSSWHFVMGHTHDNNLVVAFCWSLSLTWNKATIWDQVLYRNTPSCKLSTSHPGKTVIKGKLSCPGSRLTTWHWK